MKAVLVIDLSADLDYLLGEEVILYISTKDGKFMMRDNTLLRPLPEDGTSYICSETNEPIYSISCPLRPLNMIVEAEDRELIIYERKWFYENLECEFELQKSARDIYKKHEVEDGLED